MSRNSTTHHGQDSKHSRKHNTKQAHRSKTSTKHDKKSRENEQRDAQEKIGILPTHPSYIGNGMEKLSTSHLNNQMEFEEFEEEEEVEDYESFPSRETLKEDRDY